MDLSKSFNVGTRKMVVGSIILFRAVFKLICSLELCLNRVKPKETLVEARSGSDVQIDRQIWV
jgi:hypothetical protein